MSAKRKLLPRPRNHGTMTESAFWGSIRSALRQKSRWWLPAIEAKKRVKRKYTGTTNKRQKWEYPCAICKKGFMEKQVVIDHIIEAGTLKCAEDLPGFVERLFCEIDGFQILCEECHHKKTQNERKRKRL